MIGTSFAFTPLTLKNFRYTPMDGLEKLSIPELCDLLATKTLLLLNLMQKKSDGFAVKHIRKEVIAVQKILEEKRKSAKHPQ